MSRTATDTIAAISSPPGRSARGMIRISGPLTQQILQSLHITLAPPRTQAASRLRTSQHAPPLPALVTFFESPRSFTGDDLAELQLPGNPALLDRVLHAILSRGARLAEPGEFTFRAYLAGKLDLTQAEGIAATIAAVSDSQLKAASLLRDGVLGKFAADLVQELATQLALVEAGIDFVDQDDVVVIGPAALDAALSSIEVKLNGLLARSRSWGAIEALPRVVLVGAPSTGKSTLFNALLGRRRAVVHEQPGTTRDVLAEPLMLHDEAGREIEVMLIDMAGLDAAASTGTIDSQMQSAARAAINTADLLLLVRDATNPAQHSFELPLHACGLAGADLATKPTIHLLTKSDLTPAGQSPDCLSVSAHTGHNLDLLLREIARRLADRAVSVTGDLLALQPRHECALRAAAADLAAARGLLAPQRRQPSIDHVELVAGSLRSALDHLAALGGTMTPDDVIGRVFATFCIGK